VSEAKRLKQLKEENAKLKRILADQALDVALVLSAKFISRSVHGTRTG
jgi:hypothetical protein